jgi:sugar lactone lactonase YvrE
MRSFLATIFWLIGIGAITYLLIWPVPILPEAWDAPKDKGYVGVFKKNRRLGPATAVSIGNYRGPEHVAVDGEGQFYVPSERGSVLRVSNDGKKVEVFANTGGRPLGMMFDGGANLIVADAVKGLLSIDPTGKVSVLADQSGRIRINFANSLDIASDGRIYFTDSSTKFRPSIFGTRQASLYDLLEHGGKGRLLRFDPISKAVDIILEGLQFANGITLSHDKKSIYLAETGAYRISRYWLSGKREGEKEIVLDNLPGFPDNITAGQNGRYWVTLVSPRVKLVDQLSSWPRIRKMTQRLPKQMRPKEIPYGHIIAFNDAGKVVQDLQDPSGRLRTLTSVTETDKELLIGNLNSRAFYRLSKTAVGL